MNFDNHNGLAKTPMDHASPGAASEVAVSTAAADMSDVQNSGGATAEPDVPPLAEEDQAALATFTARQQVLRDLTLGCIDGHHVGAYICGPPGVGKTYTVLATLRERKAYWQYHQRITAKPLYLELEKHPGAIHVIDDCEQLLSEKGALTLLRSALGGERVNGRRERRVSYSVSGSRARVLEHYFFGAVIFLANRQLTDEKPEIRAVMSRIPHFTYAPPEREIRALMRHVARQGYVAEQGRMSPTECVEVVEHVIRLAAELHAHLDLRWIEHAYSHYLTHAESGGTVDWRDMVKFHLMDTVTYFDHPPPATKPQCEQGDVAQLKHAEARRRGDRQWEIAVALELERTPGLHREERFRRWEERTGLSRPTYYRRLKAGRKEPTAG